MKHLSLTKTLFLALTCSLFLSGCGSKEKATYQISFYNDEGSLLQKVACLEGETPVYSGEEPKSEGTSLYSYSFAGWKPSLTPATRDASYLASFDLTPRDYTITFLNDDGTSLGTSSVPYGSDAAYSGATPTKASDAHYRYYFAGWDKDLHFIRSSFSTTAQYSTSTNQYTVIFKNEDSTVLDQSSVAYGVLPVYHGKTPTKASDAQYHYVFDGWDHALTSVTGEQTYIAKFKAVTNVFTVTFLNDDGTPLSTSEVEYGKEAIYNGATPTKNKTIKNSFEFNGWDHSLSNVTSSFETRATYLASLNYYHIVFANYDGKVLQEDNYLGGETPSYQGSTPLRAADAQYTYTFSGWSETIGPATSDLVYTAQYSTVTNQYHVVFDLAGGTLVSGSLEADVPYGSPAPEPISTKDGYGFGGWSSAVSSVKGNMNVSAVWLVDHHISFDVNGGEETYEPMLVHQGLALSLPTPTLKGENFLGWYDGETLLDSSTYPYDKDVSLKAKWSGLATYTCTLDHGTLFDEGKRYTSVSFTYQSDLTLENPTLANYVFQGWIEKEGDTPSKDYHLVGRYADFTLKAVWVGEEYTIAYDFQGGSASSYGLKVNYGTSYSLVVPTKAKYYFKGWASDTSGKTMLTNGDGASLAPWTIANSEKMATVYAQWGDAATILLDGSPAYYEYGKPYTLPTPSKTGYEFLGWLGPVAKKPMDDAVLFNNHYYYYSKVSRTWAQSKSYCESLGGHLLTITSDEEGDFINKQWVTKESYFEPYIGGYRDGNSSSYPWKWVTGETWTVTCIGSGWYYSGNVLRYYDGGWGACDGKDSCYCVCEWDPFTNPTMFPSSGESFPYPIGDVELLQSQWKLLTSTITYDAGGGTNPNPTVYSVRNGTLTLQAAVLPGYDFLGWFDASGKQVKTVTYGMGDLSLTAKFTPHVYSITLDPNGSSITPTSIDITYGTSYTLPTPDPRNGYTFFAWADSNGKAVASSGTWSRSDVTTLKALWNPA